MERGSIVHVLHFCKTWQDSWYEKYNAPDLRPQIQQVLLLAVMDVEEEDTINLTMFWQILDKVLQEVSGKSTYSFNPTGWVVNENPANWKSIQEIFGDQGLAKTFSCEAHFKQSVRKHADKADDPELFKDTCQRLLTVCTKGEYKKVYSKLIDMGKHCDLTQWINWWHQHKDHIFHAFKPFDAPNTNLAEVGQAFLTKTTGHKVQLMYACETDVANAIRQEKKVASIASGQAPLGRRPSQKQVKEKTRKRQLKYAVESGKRLKKVDATQSLSGSSNTCEDDDDDTNIPMARNKKNPSKRSSTPSSSNGAYPDPTPQTTTTRRPKPIVTANQRNELPRLSNKQRQDQKQETIKVHRRKGNIKGLQLDAFNP